MFTVHFLGGPLHQKARNMPENAGDTVKVYELPDNPELVTLSPLEVREHTYRLHHIEGFIIGTHAGWEAL